MVRGRDQGRIGGPLLRRERERWSLLLTVAALAVACVDPGSKNLEESEYLITLEPGRTAEWEAPEGSVLEGLVLSFGPRAVDDDALIEVYPLESTSSPIERLLPSAGQRLRLIGPAFGIRPQGVFFDDGDAEVRISVPNSVQDDRHLYRLISAPSIPAVAVTWRYESVETDVTQDTLAFVGTLSQSQEYWPAERASAVSEPTSAVYEVCLRPNEDPLYEERELPERADECQRDDDCVISGCSQQVCSSGYVLSSCLPQDPVCNGGCRCFSGTCRWIQIPAQ